MSGKVLIAIVVIVLIVVAGMVVSMKRSLQAGAANRDADVAAPRNPAPAQKP